MEEEDSCVIQKIDTSLNADSVEWCPYEGLEHVLLCGTYKLQEQDPQNQEESPDGQSEDHVEQTRVGGVTLYRLETRDSCQPHLAEHTRVDMCGVLDIKWPDVRVESSAFFGLVDAEGYCQLFALDESLTIQEMAKTKLSNSSLGLSLGFSYSEDKSCKVQVAASDSAGCLTVLDVDHDLRPTLSWHAHQYEAWITAFHKFDPNLVFSGGDDCRLKGWDLRDNSRPVFVSKRHQMGVCSVQSHPFQEHIFASGSYDEEVVVWDKRAMRNSLACASLGGGVWRVKWNPHNGSQILTATMYNGTHIVDYSRADSDSGCMPIVGQHGGHNLAYGADWCRLHATGNSLKHNTEPESSTGESLQDKADQTYVISTCSFYDHSLHLWKWTAGIK